MNPKRSLVTLLQRSLKAHMEFLFTTTLIVNEKAVVYEVHFANDKYTFLPKLEDNKPGSFSFKREHDEWHDQDIISPELKTQAIHALEGYLMAQH